MADAMQQEWPDQRLRILVSTTVIAIIASIFLGWRCVYGFMNGRRFMVHDYLLILSWALAVVNVVLRFILVDAGLGRHIKDPSIGMANLVRYSYFLWINQIVNIIAVALLKWSICAYLLVLDFSKLYRVIIWLSILMITALNFLAPVLTLFGCTPLEANWNRGIKEKKCWAVGTLPLSYTQGVSNILTDVVYVVAPLIYLSRVQLSKRTQWGLRIVFVLSLAATLCSIFKTIELRTLTKTMDPTWDGVNLAIWSGSELYVGILIASLPPLRKAFDGYFQRILPSTNQGSRATPAYGYKGNSSNTNGLRMSTFGHNKTGRSGHPGESALDSDDESERAILEEEEGKGAMGIMKTTKVVVTDEGEGESHKGSSPNSYQEGQNWHGRQENISHAV